MASIEIKIKKSTLNIVIMDHCLGTYMYLIYLKIKHKNIINNVVKY